MTRIGPKAAFRFSGVAFSSGERFIVWSILHVVPSEPSGDQSDTKTFTAGVDFANRPPVSILAKVNNAGIGRISKGIGDELFRIVAEVVGEEWVASAPTPPEDAPPNPFCYTVWLSHGEE